MNTCMYMLTYPYTNVYLHTYKHMQHTRVHTHDCDSMEKLLSGFWGLYCLHSL